MYTYMVKHAGSLLEETVVAGSVHYGTGSEWVKFYAEPVPNREYIPLYAIRADVVASISRVSASHFTHTLVRTGALAGKRDGKPLTDVVFTDSEDKSFKLFMPAEYRKDLGDPDVISMILESKGYPSTSKGKTVLDAEVKDSLEEKIIQHAEGKTVHDKATIAAQKEEIRRLNAELFVQKGGSSVNNEGSIVLMGDYDPKHLYYVNNLVEYQHKLYLALKTVPLETVPTDIKYWTPMDRLNSP